PCCRCWTLSPITVSSSPRKREPHLPFPAASGEGGRRPCTGRKGWSRRNSAPPPRGRSGGRGGKAPRRGHSHPGLPPLFAGEGETSQSLPRADVGEFGAQRREQRL